MNISALAKALDISPQEARRFLKQPGVDLANIAAWAQAIGPKELIKTAAEVVFGREGTAAAAGALIRPPFRNGTAKHIPIHALGARTPPATVVRVLPGRRLFARSIAFDIRIKQNLRTLR